jgi:hypothetical protein
MAQFSRATNLSRQEYRFLLLAPIRLLVGLLAGMLLSGVVLGAAWIPWFPTATMSFFSASWLFIGVVSMCSVCYGAFSLWRPKRSTAILSGCLAAGAIVGWLFGSMFRVVQTESCLRGTGPHPGWCDTDAWVPVRELTVAATVLIFLLMWLTGSTRPQRPK